MNARLGPIEPTRARRRPGGGVLRRLCVILVALAASGPAPLPAATAPPPLTAHESPRPLPALTLQTDAGAERTLADFGGKVLVLNIWATWCPPCVEELPTLDALQAALGGERFQVIALSIDDAPPQRVRDFYRELGIEHLSVFLDRDMGAMASLRINGVPATLVIDARGRERARLLGPADWASPEMLAYFRALIAAGAEE